MTKYTVHFQKGTRVGARSLRMVHVEADSPEDAMAKASDGVPGNYKLIRVDHFDENGHIEIDW